MKNNKDNQAVINQIMHVRRVEIEVVDIRRVVSDGSLKALADVMFGDSIIVKGFSVLMGKRGIFVAMPRKATKDGKWFDMIAPVNDEVKVEIETKIIEAYKDEVIK